MKLLYGPAIIHRGIFPRELKTSIHTKTVSIYSSTIYNSQVSTYGEMDKQNMAYSCYGALSAVMERNVVLTHATTWMALDNITLRNQTQEAVSCMSPLI